MSYPTKDGVPDGHVDSDDRWAIVVRETKDGEHWRDKSCGQKLSSIALILFKIGLLLGFLYLFICSLGLLGDAFKLLGGKKAGEAFRQNEILTNPIADLMIGVLVTVLLQSSSTTTSIVVAIVAAEVLPVGPAIFIIMGANIGTSVTNTIVSMAQAYDRDEFRKSFAGATVHDMFNWLCVLILLPIEWLSSSVGPWADPVNPCGLLCQISGRIVESAEGGTASNPELLKTITKPFIKSIIQLDKKVVTNIAKNPNLTLEGLSQIKAYHCSKEVPYAAMINNTCTLKFRDEDGPCGFLFEDIATKWQDWQVGLCILFLALFLLIVGLIVIVKLLTSMLQGPVARVIQKVINADFPKPFGWLTGYIAILVGIGMTMLVQSSSIFTSTMTPLVGSGILHLERMYPLTLGSNIGTTFTAILASLAIGSDGFQKSMQVAICHLFFNIFGIMIWYPIPAMRRVPIHLAKGLGNTTADHRWFALTYILIMFLAIPAMIFALSLAGWKIMLGVLLPIFIIVVVIVVINVMQRKCPSKLQPKLRTWEFLPRPCRSLSFYDGWFSHCCCCCSSKSKETDDVIDDEPEVITTFGHDNKGYPDNGYPDNSDPDKPAGQELPDHNSNAVINNTTF